MYLPNFLHTQYSYVVFLCQTSPYPKKNQYSFQVCKIPRFLRDGSKSILLVLKQIHVPQNVGFCYNSGMNRQLIFVIGIALIVLPWPQVALPYVLKLIIIGLLGLVLIFQTMKRSARTPQATEKKQVDILYKYSILIRGESHLAWKYDYNHRRF